MNASVPQLIVRALLCAFVLCQSACTAFHPFHHREIKIAFHSGAKPQQHLTALLDRSVYHHHHGVTKLFSSSDDSNKDEAESEKAITEKVDSEKVAVTIAPSEAQPTAESIKAGWSSSSSSTTVEEETEANYPIDLPSPLLLSSSMILAIAATGSIFELIGGKPGLGFPTTSAIIAVSLPLAGYLFYASILKATAETEEDDKRFLGKK